MFDIGNIVITGYPNITEFVGGTLTGEVTLQIGPLQEKMISSVPEHDHAIMTSQAPLSGAFEGRSFAVDFFIYPFVFGFIFAFIFIYIGGLITYILGLEN